MIDFIQWMRRDAGAEGLAGLSTRLICESVKERGGEGGEEKEPSRPFHHPHREKCHRFRYNSGCRSHPRGASSLSGPASRGIPTSTTPVSIGKKRMSSHLPVRALLMISSEKRRRRLRAAAAAVMLDQIDLEEEAGIATWWRSTNAAARRRKSIDLDSLRWSENSSAKRDRDQ